MPVFVHLTPARNLPAIRRGGIALRTGRSRQRGVYAMPVTHDFAVSHQWLRELRRWNGGPIVGVYFRLPDGEPVEAGHYNRPHVVTTAAGAVAHLMAGRPSMVLGYEVVIPRGIGRGEILRVKALPQVVGWRYQPGANGRPPLSCRCCERGAPGAGKLLRAVEEAEARGRPTKVVVFSRGDASYRRVARLKLLRRAGSVGSPNKL